MTSPHFTSSSFILSRDSTSQCMYEISVLLIISFRLLECLPSISLSTGAFISIFFFLKKRKCKSTLVMPQRNMEDVMLLPFFYLDLSAYQRPVCIYFLSSRKISMHISTPAWPGHLRPDSNHQPSSWAKSALTTSYPETLIMPYLMFIIYFKFKNHFFCDLHPCRTPG